MWSVAPEPEMEVERSGFWAGSCGRGDARGGGRGRALRLPAAARAAGSMLSPRIRQARRGECGCRAPGGAGGDRLPARGGCPAVVENLCPRPWSASPPRDAVAAPRQSEAAAPLAESGPGEGSGSERRLQRCAENEALEAGTCACVLQRRVLCQGWAAGVIEKMYSVLGLEGGFAPLRWLPTLCFECWNSF